MSANDGLNRSSVGEKPFAYDLKTRERWFATEAAKSKPYRVREGFCHRVDKDGASFFRFYSDEWHISNGYPAPGGASERPAHEEAIVWIEKNLRFGAATNDGPVFIVLSEAEQEFWTGRLRPDLTGIVKECWPRVIQPGTRIYIEIYLTHAVEEAKHAILLAECVPTIQISLDKELRKHSTSSVLRNREAFLRDIAVEMGRCPDGEWIVPY